MKIKAIIWIMFAAAGHALAYEPASTFADLVNLEKKVEEVSKKSLPATVALVSEEAGSSGSGVIVSEDGLILTAAHVVQGMKEMDVYFSDGKKWRGKVVGANLSKDIGMVKMSEAGPWPYVKMGESKPLEAGDWVIALGHSAGFDPARTPPVRFGRVMSDGPGNFFTTDCTLIGGDSGGPLFDLEGKLVGINSSIGVSWKNNNHAGIDGFREDWARLIAGETWGTLQMNPMANPETPVLGIGMGMDERRNGVLVTGLSPNSPAAAAGVRVGDVIRFVDGEHIRSGTEFVDVLIKREVGDTVKLGIIRDETQVEIPVELVKREELYKFSAGNVMPSSPQRADQEVPLMRPDEHKVVDSQTKEFNKALESVLADASKSTVTIWTRGANKPIAYGTVVGDGTSILTKWSEIERFAEILFVSGAIGQGAKAEVAGVFTEEDLALLTIPAEAARVENLIPAKLEKSDLSIGHFLIAARPDGKPAGFGVVGVLERNLRETDKAHLGIEADFEYRGEGVRIVNVQPEYGAAEAGLRSGDVILRVNDRELSGLQELKNALSGLNPGDKVTLRIETAGKERDVEVRLSNRPMLAQFAGGRLDAMERMGGELNRIRDNFSRVLQSDMKTQSNQIGGPVVDLDGQVVGITMARADRTRTYIMGSEAVVELLKMKTDTVAQARMKNEKLKVSLAAQNRAIMPPMRRMIKPRDIERSRRHFRDVERLLGRANRELEELGER